MENSYKLPKTDTTYFANESDDVDTTSFENQKINYAKMKNVSAKRLYNLPNKHSAQATSTLSSNGFDTSTSTW